MTEHSYPSTWTRYTLDKILTAGDTLYTSSKPNLPAGQGYLLVAELHDVVVIAGMRTLFTYINTYHTYIITHSGVCINVLSCSLLTTGWQYIPSFKEPLTFTELLRCRGVNGCHGEGEEDDRIKHKPKKTLLKHMSSITSNNTDHKPHNLTKKTYHEQAVVNDISSSWPIRVSVMSMRTYS
jgi:hypothetical protein